MVTERTFAPVLPMKFSGKRDPKKISNAQRNTHVSGMPTIAEARLPMVAGRSVLRNGIKSRRQFTNASMKIIGINPNHKRGRNIATSGTPASATAAVGQRMMSHASITTAAV